MQGKEIHQFKSLKEQVYYPPYIFLPSVCHRFQALSITVQSNLLYHSDPRAVQTVWELFQNMFKYYIYTHAVSVYI